MSSRSNAIQVKKVVKSIVDQVVSESEREQRAELNGPAEGPPADENDVRRSVRSRKEPDRLDVNQMAAAKQKETRKRAAPFKCELEMEPPPPGLRGILKKVLKPFPPPRKSSLSAAAGKSIMKKYRKVRVSRILKVKVIPPLPGWREDRTRMPEDEPDEEEQQRLQQLEKDEKKEAQRKKRKRKSLGLPTVPSVSEEDETIPSEEISGVNAAIPGSPDVFYDEYMRVNSPDSVLASDGETEEIYRPAVKSLFATIDETAESTVAPAAALDTVADPKKKERRRSVRIQPPEEEEIPKALEKKERRKSKMFPVTPVKVVDSPIVEKKPAEKSTRRKSGVVRIATTVDEPTSSSSTSRKKADYPLNPYNEEPCRSEEERTAAAVQNRKHKSNKVTAWLARPDTDPANSSNEEMESARGAESVESHVSLPSGSNGSKRLVEANSEVAKRKGRRSRKFEREVGEKSDEKENKVDPLRDMPSNSKSSNGEEKKKDKEKPQAHPFFAKFAPKPADTVAPTVPAPAAVDKKQKARRRSTFVPKKPVPVKKENGEAKKSEKKEESEGEEEAIEFVAEVKREEKKKGAAPQSAGHNTPTSVWRSTEIDAAPYAGLVHVGREKEMEDEEGDDGLVKKIRRLSVQQPAISSYAIPSSMQNGEPEPVVMIPVFDEDKHEGGD